MLSQYSSTPIGIAAIGSMTMAIKGQRALADAGLCGEVVSLFQNETRRGCAYGLAYSIAQDNAVRNTLRKAGIAVSRYFQRSNDQE